MARTTKEEAQETRNRIIDAAENVFHARGVSRTSLADVAEAAGVTRGAIYWHFKNKSDLFDAMFERVRLPLEAMMEGSRRESETDPLGQLRAGFIFVLRDAVNNPHTRKVFDIMFHKCEFFERDDPISVRQHECFSQGMTNIEETLRNAVAKAQLPAELDVRLAGAHLHAVLGGLLSNWLFAPESFDLAADAERLIDASIDTLRFAPSLLRRA
jgi:TetR/AcrR family acrAB operon transcriptional repressor